MSNHHQAADDTVQCSHCHAALGAGRGRCWTCFQAWGDSCVATTADFLANREDGWGGRSQDWLANLYATHGFIFITTLRK